MNAQETWKVRLHPGSEHWMQAPCCTSQISHVELYRHHGRLPAPSMGFICMGSVKSTSGIQTAQIRCAQLLLSVGLTASRALRGSFVVVDAVLLSAAVTTLDDTAEGRLRPDVLAFRWVA